MGGIRGVEGRAVIGIDLSPEMLAVAARKPSLAGRLAVADMRALPVGDAAADVAACCFALGYVESVMSTMAELARVARTVVVSDLHPVAVAAGWSRSFRSGSEVYQIRSYPHTLSEIDSAARAAGLEKRWERDAHFEGQEKQFFRGRRERGSVCSGATDSGGFCPLLGKTVILTGTRVAIDEISTTRADLQILNGKIHYRRSGWWRIHRRLRPAAPARPDQRARSSRVQSIPTTGPSHL